MNVDLFLKLEPLISNGMSIFQMDNFVINESITPYRKLRQALVESKARLEGITTVDLDIAELDLKRKILELEKENLQDLNRELKEIQIRRIVFEANRKSAQRLQLIHEAEFFGNMLETLINDNFGGADNAVKLLSSPEFHIQQEEEFWTKKLARSACSDFINYGTISKGVVESISCLSEEQQKAILAHAINQQTELTAILNTTRDMALVERD